MHPTIDQSITALKNAIRSSFFSDETNHTFTTATAMLNKLKENTQRLTNEQIKEKHDVIRVGVFILALQSCYLHGFIEHRTEDFDENILTNPILTTSIVDIAKLSGKESDEVIILSLGAALLFNKKHKDLLKSTDSSPEKPFGKALNIWITDHLNDYPDEYRVKNTYPEGNYSQRSLFTRLHNAPKAQRKSIPVELIKFNKEYKRQISADQILRLLDQLEKVEILVKQKGGELKLDQLAAFSLLNLKPTVREWLLQGYQLTQRHFIPRDIFFEITSYLLNLSVEQTKSVHQQVCYSLYKDASFPFWKKALPGFHEEKEKRLEKRLQCGPINISK